MTIREISAGPEWPAAVALIRELRPHVTEAMFDERYRAAHAADGYTLVGAFEGDALAGVIGYRYLVDMLHGRHIYIDDLIIGGTWKRRGVGRLLLEHVESLAAKASVGVRVSTGADHKEGRDFYERLGWPLKAVTYKRGF